MGLISKIIIVAALVFAGMWAYNNYEFDTMEVCIGNEEVMMPITCQTQSDCVMYLTSAYTAGYPRTDLFTSILSDVSSCQNGHCYRKTFDFRANRPLTNQCSNNETSFSYKVTVKDASSIRGWW